MIVIIDYGMGNVGSILNMFKKLGVSNVIVSNKIEDIEKAGKLILPGVGAFDNGMKNLKQSGLIPVLNKKVLEDKVPVLGICLGMQLLCNKSEEGEEPGLGWIGADVIRFKIDDTINFKIPHMGWNYVEIKEENPLISKEHKNRYYFVHSYYVKCNEEEDILARANHGFDFTCAVQHENIFGTQFHPEKSHKFGMKLLENFAQL